MHASELGMIESSKIWILCHAGYQHMSFKSAEETPHPLWDMAQSQ